MTTDRIFVGRQAELEQFKKVLENPQGQAVLVVGQAGMGKTWLVDRMAKIACEHPNLKCGYVRYELTSGDSVDAVMERMINDAFHAAEVVEGSFDATALRRKQWYALLETIVPKGEQISKLIQSFAREEKRPTREQFLERLRLVSAKMKNKGRAVFVIDPLEYLDKEKDTYGEDWAVVIRELPEKIKFVFAQRPEDILVRYRKFSHLSNVSMIPAKKLGNLEKQAVDELLDRRASETEYDVGELRRGLEKYEGHPYALQGALNLLATGTKLEELPDDPTEQGIIEEQWEKICKFGEAAIRLFKSYAILEVMIPDDVANTVGGVRRNERLALLDINVYLKNLLQKEGRGKRIYHLLLAKYILGQMDDTEKKEYHARAVEVYRGKLRRAKKEQVKPDELAATRLPEHILAAEGEKAFVDAFVNECTGPLLNLGLLDAAMNFSSRALGLVEKSSEEEAMISGNLGVIYLTRGELDKAEEMHKKALEIAEKFNWREAMASAYDNLGVIYLKKGELDKAEQMHRKSLEIAGRLGLRKIMASAYGNLGLIYQTRGDLDKAEEMHRKALDIAEKLGLLEGMTHQYGNLGVIYLKKREFGKAEEMYKKSLEMAEKLGLLEVMANIHVGLGVIYLKKGESDKAEEMHKKALEIDKNLGRLEGMASAYGNLGLIYQTKGELDKAEQMLRKSLEITEKLGLQEIMAIQYGNLGAIYQMRGELDKAEQMHRKALEIDEKLGRLEGMANQYGNLGALYKKRGDLKKAKEYWEKARDLFKKIGMPREVKLVEGWIDQVIDY